MILSGGNIDVNILSRIIERGLAKDGRLVRLEVQLPDEPGSLAALLAEVGIQSANVIEVHHERTFSDLGLARVRVELTLETRGGRPCAPARGRAPRARFRGHANMAASLQSGRQRAVPRAVARAPRRPGKPD